MSDNKADKKLKCHDYGVERGQNHNNRRDWEICPICGRQLLTCDCGIGGLKESQRIPYGTVREIAARIPCHGESCSVDNARKDILDAIKDRLW